MKSALSLAVLFCSVVLSPHGGAADADAIYTGGPILTMNAAAPLAGALAVKHGRIVAVGDAESVIAAEQGARTRRVDLGGRTLIPGFVDAHSHFSMVGLQAVSANLLPAPDGPGSDIPALQCALREHMANSPFVKRHGVVLGFNYDDSQLAERRAPLAVELDAVSSELPVIAIHQSAHLGVYNSKALEMAGISAATPDPAGGVIRRGADGRTPDGVLEEMAHIQAIMKILPRFDLEQGMALQEAAQQVYLANGFTTVQEGRADPGTTAAIVEAGKAGKLQLDVAIYPDLQMNENNPALRGPMMSRTYAGHARIAGVKLSFDGSPQGKTAWFTQPYRQPPHGQPADYRGYPAFPDAALAQKYVDMAYANGWQLLVHANGDAAIDALIAAAGAAQQRYGGGDRRTVLIHGQYLRADQIPQLKALGIFPALFPMHTFYWGDWHRDSVAGPERAAFISPVAAVREAGLRFTIHSDAPVTFPNSMRVLDSAVNRTTRSGQVLGPDQRLTPAQALEAMTLSAAWQHFEEGQKGSLEVGKLADLVILSANPLEVPPATIKDIRVLETIKGGASVHRAGAQGSASR
jgi:hypothetical protein